MAEGQFIEALLIMGYILVRIRWARAQVIKSEKWRRSGDLDGRGELVEGMIGFDTRKLRIFWPLFQVARSFLGDKHIRM